MASPEGSDIVDLITRVKSEGTIPLLDPDDCQGGWASPPGDIFMVRGPDYFSTRVKIRAGEYLLQPLGFDWIKGSTKIAEVLNDPINRVRKAMEEIFPKDAKPFVWAFNLQVPSKDNYSAVAYFVATDTCLDLTYRFLKGDDDFRKSRLKLIANIVQGPWILKKAVGEQAISIIGRALNCKYCVTENFLEVDIDIGSSIIASAIVHLAFGYLTTLTVDLAFLIEAQTELELPERILGAVRFSGLSVDLAKQIDEPFAERDGSLQRSVSARFWNSFGHGISNLLHIAPEGDSISSSSHLSGVVNSEERAKDVKTSSS